MKYKYFIIYLSAAKAANGHGWQGTIAKGLAPAKLSIGIIRTATILIGW